MPANRAKDIIKSACLITLGVAAASIGLKGFLLPNGFLDGGVTGISLLCNLLTNIDVSIFIVAINAPFIWLGSRQISISFAIKSTLAITILAIAVHFLTLPVITEDKLLIPVFGGFFLGAGIGLAMRGGAVIDGTEVLAVYISRHTSLTVSDVIVLFNSILFLIAASLLSIETALYSMLTYLAASKTVEFLLNGIEEYLGVTIISHQAEAIRQHIVYQMNRGITVYKGESGYGKQGEIANERSILFCVVTRLEVTALLNEIENIDPAAFVLQHPIKETKGGMIKKRPLH